MASTEPSTSGVRQPDAEQKEQQPIIDPPQPAPQQTAVSQVEPAPQDPQITPEPAQQQQQPPSLGNLPVPPVPPSGSSGPPTQPTVVESPVEQNTTRPPVVSGNRNVSMVTLDGSGSDHHALAGPSQISHLTVVPDNGRLQIGNGYSHRHPSFTRPQTAPGGGGGGGGLGGRPRTGESTIRPRTAESMRRSTLDWVVPVEERIRHSVEERLTPTLEHAIRERDKLKLRARTAKWSINIAAALQIFLGSMTTGLSAIRLDGQHFGVATTVLGIFATLTGAFLARVRATDEPETSLIRAHDLDAFIRDCEAFRLDYGLETGERYNQQIDEFRRRFEIILGNIRAEVVKVGQKSGDSPVLDKINVAKPQQTTLTKPLPV